MTYVSYFNRNCLSLIIKSREERGRDLKGIRKSEENWGKTKRKPREWGEAKGNEEKERNWNETKSRQREWGEM